MNTTKNTGLERVYEEIETYESIIAMLEETPSDMNHIHIPLAQNVLDQHKRTVECIENHLPIAASFYTNAPEIFTTLDLHWFCSVAQVFGGGMENPHIMEDLEGADKLIVPNDVCTLLRLGLYYLDAGLLPEPTMIVPSILPCDGIVSIHEAFRQHKAWRNVPFFAPDGPYNNDRRSIDYFAKELREMISFLEHHSGKKLDMDRLKEIVEETNKQHALWSEYNELRRAVPCPHTHLLTMACFSLVMTAGSGNPEHTKWYEDLVADAERRIKENEPEVPNQKVRILWLDTHPVWFNDLSPWMEEEFGVCVVMCMFGYSPYTLIDTSTEETLFQGLAKRSLIDPPMIRQNRGVADNCLGDIERIVKDYSLDCVIYPGHMGHKDGAASISMMRDKCRELGVPFLSIGVDQFDRRYRTIDEMKDMISKHFTTVGLA